MNESPSKKGLNLPFPIFYGAERGRGRGVGLILFINLISYDSFDLLYDPRHLLILTFSEP